MAVTVVPVPPGEGTGVDDPSVPVVVSERTQLACHAPLGFAAFDVALRDGDRRITSIEVDHADGSVPTVLEPAAGGCDEESQPVRVEHQYDTPGEYTIRVTVRSSDCDGSDPDTTTVSGLIRTVRQLPSHIVSTYP